MASFCLYSIFHGKEVKFTDFVKICQRQRTKNSKTEIYPDFNTMRSEDLMIRGNDFYAVWDEEQGKWSTDEDDAKRLIDEEMDKYVEEHPELGKVNVLYLKSSSAGTIDQWKKFIKKQAGDHYHPLDETLTFLNTPVDRNNYSSKHLNYALEAGSHDAWDEIVGTLYSPPERHKIEWAIGSIVTGDSKWIQKFLVFYGEAGTGKSTILNIIQELFDGYYGVFNAKEVGSANSAFALAAFKSNPLVAIQHDGDLSKIEDNTKLNSLVSHEEIEINEKYKNQYTMRIHSMLFMGTNRPVKITDSKSGIIRRLIDVSPTGNKIPLRRYNQLMKNVQFELGAIAEYCAEVYKSDPHCYDDYVPKSMIGATNDFYNFMEDNFDSFNGEDGISLFDAWVMYRAYCDDAKVPYPYPKRIFKEEMKNYFRIFKERGYYKGQQERNIYKCLKIEKFDTEKQNDSAKDQSDETSWLKFNTTESILDKLGAEWPAQYAFIRPDGSDQPKVAWDKCETILKDLNTAELHYLRCPEHIAIIDFDKKDPVTGEKSLELNMKAASKWPPTYAELSKSGAGIHLTYIYNGDISQLSPIYEEDVEVKIFTGKASLRRKLTRCNDLPIATITSGLPLRKEKKKTVNAYTIEDQKHLVAIIRKALRKEIEPFATKPCIDFIGKVLQDAYDSGMKYDVSEMKSQVLAFAASSTHNALYCMDKAESFPYKSEETSEWVEPKDKTIAFFDTEVFPNLFVLVYKPIGKDCVPLINPEPAEVLKFFQHYNAIGFNNLGYDNHICYARIRGDSIYELFVRSMHIINDPKEKSRDWQIYESKNLSYTDVFDFCSTKQGLKKWEIALQKKGVNIRHDEAGVPWDKPVPQEKWARIAEYCCNDVIATEEVFLANQSDFKAREILVDLANTLRGPGSTVNDSTNNLTTKLIVGNEKNPQALFVKPDLSKLFPGYIFNKYGIAREEYMLPINRKIDRSPKACGFFEKDILGEKGKPGGFIPTKDEVPVPGKQYYLNTVISGKSWYKGYDPGEGGFVYAEPGMYYNAICLDSASHHPSSLIAENGFGPYTENFKMLLDIRLHIKHKDYDWVRNLQGGILAKYLTSDDDAKQLSKALKIAINSVYGLTAANFAHRLHDPRNDDNWVAKRGALFMIDLLTRVQELGYKVIHVKTDSIKIANYDQKVIDFVCDYGKKFGYTFEIEHIFDRICLVNNAVYICKYSDDPANGNMAGKWEGTGDQFKEESSPYEFKTLFSHDEIGFYDLCVTQTVKVGLGLYLDFDENLPDATLLEKEEEKLIKKWHKTGYELNDENDAKLATAFKPDLTTIPDKKLDQYVAEMYHADYIRLCENREEQKKCHDYHFVGKAGLFCPMKPGAGGGRLVRENNGKYAYAAGSKDYRWLESDMVKELHLEDQIDMSYFNGLANDAIETISQFGDFYAFAQ